MEQLRRNLAALPPHAAPLARAGRLRRLAFIFCCLLASGFAIMLVIGRFWATSVGLDHDEIVGEDHVLSTYLRCRWPGDGSFWIGTTAQHRTLSEKPADFIDLGGSVFKPRVKLQPRSFWNRNGFWLVRNADEDPWNAHRWAVRSAWVAVPAWLPLAVFSIWPIRRIRFRRRPDYSAGK